jgi:hypothetical protein
VEQVEEHSVPVSDETESQGRRLGVWALWLFVALAIYVLSVGPAEKLARAGAFPRWMLVVYSPLGFASEQCPPVRRALEWYVHDLWGVPRFWTFN